MFEGYIMNDQKSTDGKVTKVSKKTILQSGWDEVGTGL